MGGFLDYVAGGNLMLREPERHQGIPALMQALSQETVTVHLVHEPANLWIDHYSKGVEGLPPVLPANTSAEPVAALLMEFDTKISAQARSVVDTYPGARPELGFRVAALLRPIAPTDQEWQASFGVLDEHLDRHGGVEILELVLVMGVSGQPPFAPLASWIVPVDPRRSPVAGVQLLTPRMPDPEEDYDLLREQGTVLAEAALFSSALLGCANVSTRSLGQEASESDLTYLVPQVAPVDFLEVRPDYFEAVEVGEPSPIFPIGYISALDTDYYWVEESPGS